MPLTDVGVLKYPAVLMNLGAVVLLAVSIAAVLRWLDVRLRFGPLADQGAGVLAVPQPRSGSKVAADQESGVDR